MAAQERDLPVVVSMGNCAASGGSWVKAPADRIFGGGKLPSPAIGVAVAFPTAENLYDYLGIQHDGVTSQQTHGLGPASPHR